MVGEVRGFFKKNNQNPENLKKFLVGGEVVTFQPTKTTTNEPQATGILREVPFFREFDDVLSGHPGKKQNPAVFFLFFGVFVPRFARLEFQHEVYAYHERLTFYGQLIGKYTKVPWILWGILVKEKLGCADRDELK